MYDDNFDIGEEPHDESTDTSLYNQDGEEILDENTF